MLRALTSVLFRRRHDTAQLAFELDSYLLLGNLQYVATRSPAAIRRARDAVEQRLTAAAAPVTPR